MFDWGGVKVKKSGIVLKIRNFEAVIINNHGEYQKIKPVKGMFEGQFVEYEEDAVLKKTGSFKYMMAIASAAAVLIIIGMLIYGFNDNNIYAFIDLDTNPSMEFTIDNKNQVVDLKIFDKNTVFPVKSKDVKGMNITHAVVYVVSNLRKTGNIKQDDNNLILITAMNVNEESQQKDQKLTGIVESLKSEIIKSAGQELKVESIIPLADIRKSSVENNISMGRYTLYTNALKSGVDITIDTAKKSDINDLIKYKNSDSKSETTQNNAKQIENTIGKKPWDKNSSLSVNTGINANQGMANNVGNAKTGIGTGPGNNGATLAPSIYPGYNNQNAKSPMDNNSPRGDANLTPGMPIPPANIPGVDESNKGIKELTPGTIPPVSLPVITPPPGAGGSSTGNTGPIPTDVPPINGGINGEKGLPDTLPHQNTGESSKGNESIVPGSVPPMGIPPAMTSPIGEKQLPPNIDSQKQSGGLNANGGAPYSGSQPAAGSHSGINGLPAPNSSIPEDHPPQVQPPRQQGQGNGGRMAPGNPHSEPTNKGVPSHR